MNFTNAKLANQDIRNHAKEKGVPIWDVAANLGMSESTISRRLRMELPETEKEKYISVIDSIFERTNGAAVNS